MYSLGMKTEKTPPSKVLIACRDDALRARVVAALSPADFEIVEHDFTRGSRAPSAPEKTSVLVFESAAGRELFEQWGDGPLGRLSLGDTPLADVCLPIDASAGELQRTCRLLSELVELRRRLIGSEDARHASAVEARTDPLSGIANRRAWDEHLARRVERWLAGEGPGCLAILDLDRFKAVNEHDGHQAGDRLLAAAARHFAMHLRRDDFLARLGGDEFGLLLEKVGAGEAQGVLERLCRALAAAEFEGVPRASVSIGYATLDSRGAATAEELFAAADEALRRAKREGRNRVCGSDPDEQR